MPQGMIIKRKGVGGITANQAKLIFQQQIFDDPNMGLFRKICMRQ